MRPIGRERHVSTADLLRFVDGEGSAAFRERVTAHLAGCAECTAAAARVRADTARLLGRLNILDDDAALAKLPATFAELSRRSSPPPVFAHWRRAAAIILFFGVGAAVARPAAAWLGRLMHTDKVSEDVTAMQPVSKTPAATPVDTMTAAYSFTPASNELRLQFADAEPDAELVVRGYDEKAASFELQSTAALPPVLILPNGVRITNGTNRGTRYELALPRNVDVLIVSIAGGSPHRIVAGSLPARINLNDGH